MSLVCRSTLVVLVMTSAFWPVPAHAESVPPHFVSMTKELLLAVRDDFTAAIGTDEQAQRLQRIYRILRREGLYNWRVTPFTRDGFVPKMAAVFGLSQIGSAGIEKFTKFLETQTGGRADAAIDELYTALGRARPTGAARRLIVDGWTALWTKTWAGVVLAHEIEASRGPQTISLTWDMARARFTIRVIDDSEASTKEMQTTINGVIRLEIDQQAQNLIVSVKPAQIPITSGKRETQSAAGQPAQPRVGPPVKGSEEKGEDNGKASGKGDIKEATKEKAKAKPSPGKRTSKQEQIDAKQRRIEELKSDKAHVWKNQKTGEVVRQKRFRKLKEPFDYKGEGYASDEAKNEVERLENEIATLDGTAPATGGRASSLGSLSGPIISLAKRFYYHDEPVVIRYSVPPKPDYNKPGEPWYGLKFKTLSGSFHQSAIMLDPKKRTKELWFSLKPGETFADYAIEVHRCYGSIAIPSCGPFGSTKHIRIVRHETPLPGAIQIAGGAIKPLGQSVFVDVHVPADRLVQSNDKHNRHGKRKFYLRLIKLGNRMRGNAITTDRVLSEFALTKTAQRFDLMEIYPSHTYSSRNRSRPSSNRPLESPGEYEIQLVTDEFVVDRKRLTVIVPELPNALRLISTEPLNVGTIGLDTEIVFDAPKLSRHFRYWLHVVRMSDDGHVGDAGNYINAWEPGKPRRISLWNSGNWAARLMLRDPKRRNYILDQLDFRVGGVSSPTNDPAITINGQRVRDAVVQTGVKFNIQISLKRFFSFPGDTVTVRLHAIPADAPKQKGRRIGTPQEWGPPIKAWPIQKKGLSILSVKRHLPVGHYGLTLTRKGRYPSGPMLNYKFRVTGNPKDAQIDLGDELTFDYGKPIPVKLKLPDGFSADDPRLSLWIEFLGGYVPGCAIEMVPYQSGRPMAYQAIPKGGTSIAVKPINRPGIYIARLAYRIYGGQEKYLPMVGTAFEVVTAPLNNALRLSSQRFEASRRGILNERLKVTANLPADHPIHHARVEIVRLGVTAVGGVTSHPVKLALAQIGGMNPSIGGSAVTKGIGVLDPGYYEARLYEDFGARSCPVERKDLVCPMLASVPFQVVLNTKSPFAPGDGGLGATNIRNDMPIAGRLWPPIGEYLDGEDCKPRVVEAEKMDLRFVHWLNGQYPPVEGDLKFGQSFYIEGRLKEPASKDIYVTQVAFPDGEVKEVPLFASKEDDKLVRSKLLYFIWESPAEISP